MKRHSRKWIFGSKAIVRDKHPRSGSRCNMPDKMAVCFGGAKVKTNHRADGRSPRLTANPPDVPKVPVRRRGCLLRMSRRRVAIRSPCCRSAFFSRLKGLSSQPLLPPSHVADAPSAAILDPVLTVPERGFARHGQFNTRNNFKRICVCCGEGGQ